jgi:glycosyltransferase involved in cell wall biosynthesis
MPSGFRPLRVLMVACRYIPYTGGVETHVYEVGRRLVRAGVEVTVLTTDVSGQLPVFEESEGIRICRVRAWPEKKDYFFAPGIYRFIRQERWDLVHCQGYHNLVPPLAMLAAWRAAMPFVLSFHSGGNVSGLRKALRGMHWKALRPLLAQAHKLIAVSQFEANFFQERLHLPKEQFVIIPNGAYLCEETGQAQGAVPTEAAVEDARKDPLIVSIGRLERYKGHQRLIEALREVLAEVPNARVRIVGTGPYEATLRKIARSLKVDEYVEIRPVSTEDRGGMAALLSRADLITLFSEYESQGIAVMEALALRRPVLVASTSALRELINRDLAYGIPLHSPPQEVARAIVDQLRNPLKPGDAELPTWDACASNLLALYRTVARRPVCVS